MQLRKRVVNFIQKLIRTGRKGGEQEPSPPPVDSETDTEHSSYGDSIVQYFAVEVVPPDKHYRALSKLTSFSDGTIVGAIVEATLLLLFIVRVKRALSRGGG